MTSKFPSLVSCTVMDWFQPWPREALASIGRHFLGKSALLDGDIRVGVERFMVNSFEAVSETCKKVAIQGETCAGSRFAFVPSSYW